MEDPRRVEKFMFPVRSVEVVREESDPLVTTKEEPVRVENPISLETIEVAEREEVVREEVKRVEAPREEVRRAGTERVEPMTRLSMERVL